MNLKNLILLPIFSVFALISCKSPTDPYSIGEIDSSKITDEGDFVNSYENGSKLIIKENYKVKFNNDYVTYLGSKDKVESGYYFVTTSNTTPTLSRITPDSIIGTSKQSYKTNFYIAYIHTDNKVYVSVAKPVTITNKQALNPILYYVGGAVIIVAVAGLVFFSRRYKEKHPN